jgi:hypothetical protein
MKSHLMQASIFRMGVRVLAAAALIVSGVLLAFVPARTAAAATVSLQCQVGASATGENISCTDAVAGATTTLNCQSSNVITQNGGVYTVAPATCSGSTSLAGVDIVGSLSMSILTIDTNTSMITATNGTGTLSYSQGISSATATCTGGFFSQTLSPLVLTIPDGSCNINVSVLGIGTAQIAVQGGSISAITSPSLALVIDSPKISVNASALGLVTQLICGNATTVNLAQMPPIVAPLARCGS